jgi:uncharacterized protein
MPPRARTLKAKVTRLRTSGGANFTAAGGRKAAHFVDRELKQLLAARETAVSGAGFSRGFCGSLLVGSDTVTAPSPGVIGPTLPLTNVPAISPAGALTTGNIGLQGDPLVNRAFRAGLPPAPQPGRADEFKPPS